MIRRPRRHAIRANESGATSIEFGMLALPFFLSMLMVAETSLESMKQTTLDGAIQKIAETLHTTRFTPLPSATTLRKDMCAIVARDETSCPDSLAIELVPLSAANGAKASSPVNRVDLGASNELLMLRAQMEFSSVIAGSALKRNLYTTRLVRRP